MLYREQRGGFLASLETTISLPQTRLALFCHLYKHLTKLGMEKFKMDDVEIKYYAEDLRHTDWIDTYLVKIKGDVVGFTNRRPE